jgi:hypothetical protein
MDAIANPGMPPTPDETEPDQRADPTTQPADPKEIEFVEGRLSFFIGDYKRKRNNNRDLSNSVKITTIAVGAIVTILIGLKPSFDATPTAPWLSALTLVLSAGLTSLGAWEAFADHRWKWIRYRATLSALYTIQDDFHFRRKSKQNLTVKEVEEFYMQMRGAVHETNQEWMSQRGNAISDGGKGGAKGVPA